ncbi:MAG: nuclear transport factor 2 family protein [Sphingomonadales bacterium]|nr:nuclear transport factor 2 family protein [Sphingomonadales bacterium]
MSAAGHRLALAYFAAVEAGELPDSLLTADMTAWTTTQGTMGKAAYRYAIRLLAQLCSQPITFTVDAITAEDDRVVAEARSRAVLIDGSPYANTYVFALRIRDGRIAHIAEHFNALIVQEKLLPLLPLISGAS